MVAAAGLKLGLTEEEMVVEGGLGFPKGFAKLCRNSPICVNPYCHGPPSTFLPYQLHPQEALKIKDFNDMFPVSDPEAAPSVNPRAYVNLLWKQLDHLGNAGFDPALFRVDPYGNVIYLHANSSSPLSWDIDHWFPLARGGKTVPSNLRILQHQVCEKKQNKLEFLIPWWDLQLGISVNQFLSIFASKNADFRNQAFSFFFSDGGNEELNSRQTVEAHAFPQHFCETRKKVGLAPAALVLARNSDVSVLKPVDINRSHRAHYPLIAARKFPKDANLEEHENAYCSVAAARDSLRQREEMKKKKEAELSRMDDELSELAQRSEADRLSIEELEDLLIKRRRRLEKSRRLAEAQSSYKNLLEKMIRDAMHRGVVYKEQLRLNQAATSTLMARLEAQRAMCDSSENELRRKYRQRDNLEKQIDPFKDCNLRRKRSQMDDLVYQDAFDEELRLASSQECSRSALRKELRVFLEEEKMASEAALSLDDMEEASTSKDVKGRQICGEDIMFGHRKIPLREKLREKCVNRMDGTPPPSFRRMKLGDTDGIAQGRSDRKNDDEEHMNEVGKGNLEKWMQMLIENSGDQSTGQGPDEHNVSEKDVKFIRFKPQGGRSSTEIVTRQSRNSFDAKDSDQKSRPAAASVRTCRSLPSSPSTIRRQGGEEPGSTGSGRFLKKCTGAIKKAMNK